MFPSPQAGSVYKEEQIFADDGKPLTLKFPSPQAGSVYKDRKRSFC